MQWWMFAKLKSEHGGLCHGHASEGDNLCPVCECYQSVSVEDRQNECFVKLGSVQNKSCSNYASNDMVLIQEQKAWCFFLLCFSSKLANLN